MRIEVLHIEDYPSWFEAGRRLREALDATGFGETTIAYRLLSGREEAAQAPFAGSPTITVDDQDLFPSVRMPALRSLDRATGAQRPTEGRLTTGQSIADGPRPIGGYVVGCECRWWLSGSARGCG